MIDLSKYDQKKIERSWSYKAQAMLTEAKANDPEFFEYLTQKPSEQCLRGIDNYFMTLEQYSAILGISEERVRQIFACISVKSRDHMENVDEAQWVRPTNRLKTYGDVRKYLLYGGKTGITGCNRKELSSLLYRKTDSYVDGYIKLRAASYGECEALSNWLHFQWTCLDPGNRSIYDRLPKDDKEILRKLKLNRDNLIRDYYIEKRRLPISNKGFQIIRNRMLKPVKNIETLIPEGSVQFKVNTVLANLYMEHLDTYITILPKIKECVICRDYQFLPTKNKAEAKSVSRGVVEDGIYWAWKVIKQE